MSIKSGIGKFVGIVFLILAMVVGKMIGEAAFRPGSSRLDQSDIEEASRALNANLPMMVDAETRWDSTDPSESLTLNYRYTLVHFASAEVDRAKREANFPAAARALCGRPKFKEMLVAGATARYYYRANDGVQVGAFELSPTGCAATPTIKVLANMAPQLVAHQASPGVAQNEREFSAKAANAGQLHAPASGDDVAWKHYLQQIIGQNLTDVTGRVFPYYLPLNSTTPTPGEAESNSRFDLQLENVSAIVSRGVLPGNMLAFGSPDSSKMADLLVTAFSGGKRDALSGSQILFVGQAKDSLRVRVAAESVGARYIFVEAN